MALSNAELERIKAELGYNVLTIGALPYVGFSQMFTNVVQAYMSSGASTTSSTAVTAATTATPATLTLASGTGFTATSGGETPSGPRCSAPPRSRRA